MIWLRLPARKGLWVAAIVCLLATLPAVVRAAPYAAYVMDARTGEVLYAENAETRLHPASLTKMMTLYITFQAIERGEISLDTKAVISRNAAGKPPSRLGLRTGQKIAVRYLIRAAALRSANDAATALGELLGGSEAGFAKRMNATAKQIGMTQTTFVNPHGWTTQGHLSTARDMTVLGRRLFFDFPQYYNIFSRRTSDAGIAEVANTNRKFLDSYKGADGIKTGFTNAAGFNLTASAERGGVRIIATVMGGASTPDRNAKMARLLDLGFQKAKPGRGKAMPEPALVAQADPEVPGVAAAMASAAAAVKSAKALLATREEDDAESAAEARTSRLVLARSERPRGRPAAAPDPAVVAAIRENIADIVQEVQGADASRPSASLVMAAAAPAARPAAPEPAASPARGASGPAAAASLLAAPESVVAAAEPATPAAEPLTIAAVAAPKSRPVRAVAPAAAALPVVAPAVARDTTESPAAAEVQMAAVRPTAPAPAAARAPAPAALSAAPPQGPEVVTRLSTSGGRYWGISLGRFNSRYEAEKVLLRTALSEIGTLDGALRKVVQRPTGFDATFMGLSQDTADLACRRLHARNVECFTVGP